MMMPALYPYIAMGVVSNFLVCQWMQPLAIAKKRVATFTKEFKDELNAEHKQHFPEGEVDGIGQPDQGTGWYSRKLPLDKWVAFMSSQRVLMNYVEWMPLIAFFTLICGWLFPLVGIVTSWAIVLGRIMYVIGYLKAPHLRGPGFILQFLAIFINVILSFTTAIMCIVHTA